MIAKCTKCGHQQREDRPAYSSPIVQCQACGTHYYEEKFREAALFPPSKQTIYRERTSYIAAGLEIILSFVVLLYLSAKGGFWLALFLIFLPTCILACWYMEYPYVKEKRYKAAHTRAMAESNQRLRSKDYQDLLLQACGNRPKIANALERYSMQHSPALQDASHQQQWTHIPEKGHRESAEQGRRRIRLERNVRRWIVWWRIRCRLRKDPGDTDLFIYKNRLYDRSKFIQLGTYKLSQLSHRWLIKEHGLLALQETWENDLLITKEPDYVLAKLEIVQVALSWC